MRYFFAVLEVGIPLVRPYLIGYMGEKFGEPGSLPAKGDFASFGTPLYYLYCTVNEFNLIFSSEMERT